MIAMVSSMVLLLLRYVDESSIYWPTAASLIHLLETLEQPREVPDVRGACAPFRGGARQEAPDIVFSIGLASVTPFIPRSRPTH
jgi:hypothetical protein